ncbi:MAG: hypothetical protein LBD98_04850 [Endomicrobium sp.]|jgi:hypothetical protein|nr:hypothetical protein [Endomicrobium sp.]
MLKDFRNYKYKKKILCFLEAKNRFDLFYDIAKNNYDMLFFISSLVSKDEFYRHKIAYLKNVFLCENNANKIRDLFLKVKIFGLHITTYCQPSSAHIFGLKVVKLCNKVQIPVLELQHGMFQLGLHYYNASKTLESDSLPVESYADKCLSYYPVDDIKNQIVIGYPNFAKPAPAIKGNYTLVLTNLHWNVYEKINVYKFYYAVIKFASENPSQIFLWLPHAGETLYGGINHTFIKSLLEIYPSAKKNFINVKENKVSSLVPTSEYIRKAGHVISTISTTLLDCEMYKKPTIIWESEETKVLLDKIKTKTSFRDYNDLCKVFYMPHSNLYLKSGLLLPYDNAAFREAVDKHYRQPPNSPNMLSDILAMI